MSEQLTPPLRRTLAAVAQVFAGADDPWWIISSAAVALHGATPIQVGDVDVLASERDARMILEAQGIEPAPGPANPLFRSAVFGRWQAAPLSVEIMVGFQVRQCDQWKSVRFVTRETVTLDGQRLFVPSRDELGQLLRSFGRPKDHNRAALLADNVGRVISGAEAGTTWS